MRVSRSLRRSDPGSCVPIPCGSSLCFEQGVHTICSRFSTLPASLGSSAVATSEALVLGFCCTYFVAIFFRNHTLISHHVSHGSPLNGRAQVPTQRASFRLNVILQLGCTKCLKLLNVQFVDRNAAGWTLSLFGLSTSFWQCPLLAFIYSVLGFSFFFWAWNIL